ncbi:MAG: hypothetical protein U0841_11475 [Chloroflexia bacterium]
MIVLDEQLTGRGLESSIGRWYRGVVCFITALRSNIVIKDEAIPSLLRQQRHPTFVTINEQDFWRHCKIDNRFCVVCFALNDSQVALIDPALRSILRHPHFRTKANRMGSVIRISEATVAYYRHDDQVVRALE